MEGIKEGQIWAHTTTGNNYIVKSTNMRFKLPTGEWIDGILYAPMYESNWNCFVRSVDSFLNDFTLVE